MNLKKFIIPIIAFVIAGVAFHKFNQYKDPSIGSLESSKTFKLFESWRLKHHKVYNSPEEKLYRFKIFVKSYSKVLAHDN